MSKAPAVDPDDVKEPKKIAFALGGLGGNNAHGAGFLQAALDEGIKPDIISCTSGQIYWVHQYLTAPKPGRPDPKHKVLRDQLSEDLAEMRRFPSTDLNLMALGLFGKPRIMRVAWAEWCVDWVANGLSSLGQIVRDLPHPFIAREALRTLPARQLVMEIGDEFFQKIAREFNRSTIGIAFNSFDPVSGRELVHLNPATDEFLGKKIGRRRALREHTDYRPITPEAVRDGLWIYQYGFRDNSRLDGAYYRQIMLDELMPARDVFVARPIRFRWVGPLPTSWPEVEDMKVEMAFNGSYCGERDKIDIVNNLIEKRVLKDRRYQPVKLHEIELREQRSYFDYVLEDEGVFDRACARATREFKSFKNGH